MLPTKMILIACITVVTAKKKAPEPACDVKAWFSFARSGDHKSLAHCLETIASTEGSDAWLKRIEAKDEAGCPAVVATAMNDHIDTLRYLASKGADLNAACWSGTTALMHASQRGYLDIVKFLHRQDVDVEAALNDKGWTALTFAARHGHFDVLKYLHKLDLELDAAEWKGDGLQWAAAVGDSKMVGQLLAEGKFDIAATDGHGYTAAFWAIQHGHLNTLDVLRAGGAKLDLTSLGGMSMLATAAYHGYVEICVYLLEQGLGVDQEDLSGWTPLMWAAAGNNMDAIKLFEKVNADRTPKQGGWDPVMVAAAAGNEAIVEWLLARGLSFTGLNHEGKSAAVLAEENGHTEIAGTLERMWEINKWHAEKAKRGHKNAQARERALLREAEGLAATENSGMRPAQSRVDKHLDALKARDAEKEKIARLREQQILEDNEKQTAQGRQELYKMLKRKFGKKGRSKTDL